MLGRNQDGIRLKQLGKSRIFRSTAWGVLDDDRLRASTPLTIG
jgi:hypothetical protein